MSEDTVWRTQIGVVLSSGDSANVEIDCKLLASLLQRVKSGTVMNVDRTRIQELLLQCENTAAEPFTPPLQPPVFVNTSGGSGVRRSARLSGVRSPVPMADLVVAEVGSAKKVTKEDKKRLCLELLSRMLTSAEKRLQVERIRGRHIEESLLIQFDVGVIRDVADVAVRCREKLLHDANLTNDVLRQLISDVSHIEPARSANKDALIHVLAVVWTNAAGSVVTTVPRTVVPRPSDFREGTITKLKESIDETAQPQQRYGMGRKGCVSFVKWKEKFTRGIYSFSLRRFSFCRVMLKHWAKRA